MVASHELDGSVRFGCVVCDNPTYHSLAVRARRFTRSKLYSQMHLALCRKGQVFGAGSC
jgi:hypothetical protein